MQQGEVVAHETRGDVDNLPPSRFAKHPAAAETEGLGATAIRKGARLAHGEAVVHDTCGVVVARGSGIFAVTAVRR